MNSNTNDKMIKPRNCCLNLQATNPIVAKTITTTSFAPNDKSLDLLESQVEDTRDNQFSSSNSS